MCCESEIIVKMTKVCSRCGVEKADGYIWKVTDNIRTKIIIKKKENTCQNAA